MDIWTDINLPVALAFGLCRKSCTLIKRNLFRPQLHKPANVQVPGAGCGSGVRHMRTKEHLLGWGHHRQAASLAATVAEATEATEADMATAMHYKFSCFSTCIHINMNECEFEYEYECMTTHIHLLCIHSSYMWCLLCLFNYSIIINDITYAYNGIKERAQSAKCCL